MSKQVFQTLLSLALFAACSASPSVPEPLRLTDRVACFVTTWSGSGSGFPSTATEMITAWHVVEGVSPSSVTVNGLHPIRIDRLGDLDAAVLVFVEPHGLEPWPMDVRPVDPAEAICCSGWGAGYHWWSEGLGTMDAFRLSLTIAPGDSGCPVLDEDLEVVGIVVARGRLAHHHCYIVTMVEIGRALELRAAD